MVNCDSCGSFMEQENKVVNEYSLINGVKQATRETEYYTCPECELSGRVLRGDSDTFYGVCVEESEGD